MSAVMDEIIIGDVKLLGDWRDQKEKKLEVISFLDKDLQFLGILEDEYYVKLQAKVGSWRGWRIMYNGEWYNDVSDFWLYGLAKYEWYGCDNEWHPDNVCQVCNEAQCECE